MHTVILDHLGLKIDHPYITDLRRRPVPGARLTREVESLVVTFLDDVMQSGIPFEGIGVQYYNPGRDLLECALQLDAFAEFGKGLWITDG